MPPTFTALVHVLRKGSLIWSHRTLNVTLSPPFSRFCVIDGSKYEPRMLWSDQRKISSPLTSSVATPLSLNGFSMRTSVRSNVCSPGTVNEASPV